MMVQWLLIGGSMDGQTHWAEASEVKLDFNSIDGSKVDTYRGLTHHRCGMRYRIGLHSSMAKPDMAKVEHRLLKAQPQPIGRF